jgi:uncharacterized membrane protein YhaH (DUF805 family)
MGNPVNVGIAVQADWENREFISNISLNVRRLFDFLLRFGPFFLFLPLPPYPSHNSSMDLHWIHIYFCFLYSGIATFLWICITLFPFYY